MRAPVALVLAVSLALGPTWAAADQVAPGAPTPAPAPPPAGGDAEADRLLDEGTRLYTQDADYDAALEAFRRSYELRPSWKALSGTANVYQQQGRLVEAIETYERLLAEFGATLTEGQLGTLKKRVVELERRVGVVVVTIAQEGVFVTIDGQEVGRGPLEARRRRLLPGPHTLVATLDGHITLTRRLDVRAGDVQPLTLTLEPERVKVVVEKQPARFERRFAGWVPWAVIGGGLALGAIGGGLHLQAASELDQHAEATNLAPPDAMGIRHPDPVHYDRAGTYQAAAISLYVVGGAVLVSGLVLVYANRPRPVETPRAAAVRPLLGTRSVGVAIDF